MHRCHLRRHFIGLRWTIGELEVDLPASSVDHARLLIVREGHSIADVPCWKPCVRYSLRYASATLVDAKVAEVIELPAQLELPLGAAA